MITYKSSSHRLAQDLALGPSKCAAIDAHGVSTRKERYNYHACRKANCKHILQAKLKNRFQTSANELRTKKQQ
jgi:hypothetical protein